MNEEINIKIINATPIEANKTYALQVSGGYSPEQLNELLRAFKLKTGADAIIMSNVELVSLDNE